MGCRARSEEEQQCANASCFCEERGFLACHMVRKDTLLLVAKLLILLVLFFFPGQMLFPFRDALYANQGDTTSKKVLKAITLVNSVHWGIPAYHLSFLFSVLYKILLCMCFFAVFNVCPADLLLMNYSACILQGSMSVFRNKRQ
ncbi:hypothetical protein Nmel_001725 [Mimus melanotis]